MNLSLVLYTHILIGSIALLSGFLPMLAKKGGFLHRKSGILYFYSMIITILLSLILAFNDNLSFLGMVGVFSLYQTIEGYLAIRNKSLKFNISDWLALPIFAINAVCMLLSFKIVLLVFACISFVLIFGRIKDLIQLRNGKYLAVNAYLRRHIGMILGSYVSALTAFLVNVSPFGSSAIIWLLPTVLILPIGVYWTNKISKIVSK